MEIDDKYEKNAGSDLFSRYLFRNYFIIFFTPLLRKI